MRKFLIIFEADEREQPPPIIRAMSDGTAPTGATVRVRALTDARLQDLEWADHLVLAIQARGEALPPAVKAWVDGLGFPGWRAFRNKSGSVLPIVGNDIASREALPVCRAVLDCLTVRGMSPITAGHAGIPSAERRIDGAEPGHLLGSALVRAHHPPALADARQATAARPPYGEEPATGNACYTSLRSQDGRRGYGNLMRN